MKIIDSVIYEGKNIYSHKKCIKITVDLEGYCEIPSKDIEGFNENLIQIVPELRKHRCGIDEDEGFIKRLREGTYLSHICEHLIIAIQNVIGVDISYGKAREIKDDIYFIVYQYQYAKVGIETAKLAVDIINSLICGKSISVDERILILKEILKEHL
jgi:cyanophycin synthetase